jgi:hypothetical protein
MNLIDTMKNHLGDSTFDALIVIPHPEKKDSLHIEFLEYKDVGEKLGGAEYGDQYDILLFQENKEGEFYNKDRFAAILIDPIEYSARLAKGKIYGIIGKKTTTSDEFFDNMDKALELK